MRFANRVFSQKSHLQTAIQTQVALRQGFLEGIFEIEACADNYIQNSHDSGENATNALPMNTSLSIFTASLNVQTKVEEHGFFVWNQERTLPHHHGSLKTLFKTFHAQEHMKLKHISHHLYEIQHHKGKKDFDKLTIDIASVAKLLEAHFDSKGALLALKGTTKPENFEDLSKKMKELFRSNDPNYMKSNITLARKVLEELMILKEDEEIKRKLIVEFRTSVTGDVFDVIKNGSKILEGVTIE
jgi:hypothetical protein